MQQTSPREMALLGFFSADGGAGLLHGIAVGGPVFDLALRGGRRSPNVSSVLLFGVAVNAK